MVPITEPRTGRSRRIPSRRTNDLPEPPTGKAAGWRKVSARVTTPLRRNRLRRRLLNESTYDVCHLTTVSYLTGWFDLRGLDRRQRSRRPCDASRTGIAAMDGTPPAERALPACQPGRSSSVSTAATSSSPTFPSTRAGYLFCLSRFKFSRTRKERPGKRGRPGFCSSAACCPNRMCESFLGASNNIGRCSRASWRGGGRLDALHRNFGRDWLGVLGAELFHGLDLEVLPYAFHEATWPP